MTNYPALSSSRAGASQQSAGGPLKPAAAPSIPFASAQKADRRPSCGTYAPPSARAKKLGSILIGHSDKCAICENPGSYAVGRRMICETCFRAAMVQAFGADVLEGRDVRAADPATLFRPGGRTLADVWGLR